MHARTHRNDHNGIGATLGGDGTEEQACVDIWIRHQRLVVLYRQQDHEVVKEIMVGN